MKKISLKINKVNLKSNNLAVKLHGFLMHSISDVYANYLHSLETNPFSTQVRFDGKYYYWIVSLLSDEIEKIILPFLKELREFRLEDVDEALMVYERTITETTNQQLIQIFKSDTDYRSIKILFNTPTSFKSRGEYVIFPTSRLVFQSLMQKYSRIIEEKEEIDFELLEFIEQQTRITSYQLKTSYFKIHNKSIPAFVGSITIQIRGAKTLKSYVSMLLEFGKYSGVGIKSSLGMGGIEFEERRN